jgi:hypothetical protein
VFHYYHVVYLFSLKTHSRVFLIASPVLIKYKQLARPRCKEARLSLVHNKAEPTRKMPANNRGENSGLRIQRAPFVEGDDPSGSDCENHAA